MKLTRYCLFLILGLADVCDSPPRVSHATARLERQDNIVTLAHYTCDASQGYAARGNSTRACLEAAGHGVWVPSNFRCESKSFIQVIYT